jgi:hypothetical protein
LGFEKTRPSASVDEFYTEATQQIESRNERIKKLLMVDPGPYDSAQEALLDLMRKENEFVRTEVRFFRLDSEFPDKVESFKSQFNIIVIGLGLTRNVSDLTHDYKAELRDLCQQATEMQKLQTQFFAAIAELKQAPDEAEVAKHEAVDSWNKAYGWFRWSGVSVEPSNSIRAYPSAVLNSELIAGFEQRRADLEKRASDTVEQACH